MSKVTSITSRKDGDKSEVGLRPEPIAHLIGGDMVIAVNPASKPPTRLRPAVSKIKGLVKRKPNLAIRTKR